MSALDIVRRSFVRSAHVANPKAHILGGYPWSGILRRSSKASLIPDRTSESPSTGRNGALSEIGLNYHNHAAFTSSDLICNPRVFCVFSVFGTYHLEKGQSHKRGGNEIKEGEWC